MNTSRHLSLLVLLVLDAAPCLPAPAVAPQVPPATASAAQDTISKIDTIFSWATPATPGCVAAASRHGQIVVNRAYGLADLERNVPLSPDSGKGGLTVRVNESPTQVVELGPVDPDTFQRGMQAVVRFRRDQAGRVMGFDFNTPALRNIRFTRLSDRAISAGP